MGVRTNSAWQWSPAWQAQALAQTIDLERRFQGLALAVEGLSRSADLATSDPAASARLALEADAQVMAIAGDDAGAALGPWRLLAALLPWAGRGLGPQSSALLADPAVAARVGGRDALSGFRSGSFRGCVLSGLLDCQDPSLATAVLRAMPPVPRIDWAAILRMSPPDFQERRLGALERLGACDAALLRLLDNCGGQGGEALSELARSRRVARAVERSAKEPAAQVFGARKKSRARL